MSESTTKNVLRNLTEQKLTESKLSLTLPLLIGVSDYHDINSIARKLNILFGVNVYGHELPSEIKDVARPKIKSSYAGILTKSPKYNQREFEQAFPQFTNRDDILGPLKLTETDDKYDVFVNVNGGGTTGQAQAIRLGIARALIDINPDFRPKLKIEGYLTRDPRMVERKKYGQPKARKRFQFSKR